VELFFDVDRNDKEDVASRNDPRWRILVWKTTYGDSEINPDAPYSDASPGMQYSFTEGLKQARTVIEKLKKRTTVYFADVIPATQVVDKTISQLNDVKERHRYVGPVSGEQECQNEPFKLGFSKNSEGGGSTP
jgi:hypothetical protein